MEVLGKVQSLDNLEQQREKANNKKVGTSKRRKRKSKKRQKNEETENMNEDEGQEDPSVFNFLNNIGKSTEKKKIKSNNNNNSTQEKTLHVQLVEAQEQMKVLKGEIFATNVSLKRNSGSESVVSKGYQHKLGELQKQYQNLQHQEKLLKVRISAQKDQRDLKKF